MIDFVLSNFANAGYLKIVVLTQYKSHSLDRQISQTWRFSTMLGNYVTPVPAQMRRGPYWFLGSADAIYQNLNLIGDERPEHVCVFGADHIYRMDPRPMVEQHVESGAGVTVAAIPVPREQSRDFGVIEADEQGRIIRFHEKSEEPPSMPGDPTRCLASMGNYVFETQALIDIVTASGTDKRPTDIGGDVIPALTGAGAARLYDFSTNEIPGQGERERGYWRDVGTLDAYYDANMDHRPGPRLQPLQRRHRPQSPAGLPASQGLAWRGRRAGGGRRHLLCQGSITLGAHVARSIVGNGAFVDCGARVVDSILFPGVHSPTPPSAAVSSTRTSPCPPDSGSGSTGGTGRFAMSDSGVAIVEKGQVLDGGTSAVRRHADGGRDTLPTGAALTRPYSRYALARAASSARSRPSPHRRALPVNHLDGPPPSAAARAVASAA